MSDTISGHTPECRWHSDWHQCNCGQLEKEFFESGYKRLSLENESLRSKIQKLEELFQDILSSDTEDAWYVAKQNWKEYEKQRA